MVDSACAVAIECVLSGSYALVDLSKSLAEEFDYATVDK
jgi:hypothetical protein